MIFWDWLDSKLRNFLPLREIKRVPEANPNPLSEVWVIEQHGQPIAFLTEPRYEDMFWTSYRMDIITDHPELQAQMLTKEFWANAETEGIIWRNQASGYVAECAFPALSPFPEPGRLSMRAMY